MEGSFKNINEQSIIDSVLYERVYEEIDGYGVAEQNHCPGLRLYPHYKDHLTGKIIDLGSGTGETVEYYRKLKYEAHGLDWIEPRNKFCKKANITLTCKLHRYQTATCFDVIEHLTNGQVIGLFKNMMACDNQIFSIANSPSIAVLKDNTKIDLHINKKSFETWRGIILNYFNIIREIPIKNHHRLYICSKKQETEEYNIYMAKHLRKQGYKVYKKVPALQIINKGYWYYPVQDFVYNKNYFDKYKKYSETTFGIKLLQSRMGIIKKYKGKLLDIGIGCGAIINEYKNSVGYDVNPMAIKELQEKNKWFDPYIYDNKILEDIDIITFFDSFEHIKKPELLLNKITHQIIIICIPIFKNYKHLKYSKHFRKDEHYHYFTYTGFINYMKNFKLELIKYCDNEIQIGREDIYTFVFKKKVEQNEDN